MGVVLASDMGCDGQEGPGQGQENDELRAERSETHDCKEPEGRAKRVNDEMPG